MHMIHNTTDAFFLQNSKMLMTQQCEQSTKNNGYATLGGGEYRNLICQNYGRTLMCQNYAFASASASTSAQE